MYTLITGNRGFIGSGLQGDGIDLKDGVDILTYKAKKKYDVVIHTAARVSVTESEKDPDLYFKTNVQGTWNMVRQHPEAHFVYLSTAAIYGEGEGHTISSPFKPSSVYALTKYLGEVVVKEHAKSWCILRLTNVYGDEDRGEPNVLQIFRKSDVLPIYGDGFQTRDFIPVKMVRKAILDACGKQGVFNVGSGTSQTIFSIAQSIGKPIQFLPPRDGEIRKFGIKDAFGINSK